MIHRQEINRKSQFGTLREDARGVLSTTKRWVTALKGRHVNSTVAFKYTVHALVKD